MIEQLGNFRLIKKLGEGGMGAVYLAEDIHVQRKVALKILPDQMSRDKEFLSRFRREAKATGRLNHINIVSAFTVGEDKGYHYFAMEFCPGTSLDGLIKTHGVIGWRQATDLVLQIAAGLKHAHAHGFIHRDIKPHNIILGDDGVAKILDMGLSKNISGDEQSFATQSGSVLGTPHYIAPEQARAEDTVDGRVDIYSLGATFFHLITGKTVFTGSSAMAIIAKHMTEPAPDVQKVQPGIPDGVAYVIKRMMAKNPADRYRDCDALITDLERVKAGDIPAALETALANTLTVEERRSSIDRRERANQRTIVDNIANLPGQPHASPSVKAQRRDAERKAAKPALTPLHFYIGAGVVLLLLIGWLALRGKDTPVSGTNTVSQTPPAPTPASPTQPLTNVPPPTNPVTPTPLTNPTPQPTPTPPADTARKWVNLVRMIDPAKDTRKGTWTLENGALRAAAQASFATIQSPYRPPEEYDFRTTFTVQNGVPDVNMIVFKDGRPFHWMIGGNKNSVLGFAKFNRTWDRHPSSVARPNCLENKRQYSSHVEVRRDSIKGYLDGQLVVTLDRDLGRFFPAEQSGIDDKAGVGVLAHECDVIFHSIEVRDVTGNGTWTRDAGK